MLTAVLYGLAASSALLIGAALGTRWNAPRTVTGVLLAFASGALISALAFELFEVAFELGGAVRSGLGLLAGAVAFVATDAALDRYVAGHPGAEEREVVAEGARGGVGWALLAAVTLDGVPENLALGVSLVEGASITLLVAIFFSNLPESLVGAQAMRSEGRSPRIVLLTWLACAVLLTLAVILGRGIGGGLSDEVLAVALGFAGGAVLASLADTLMPEAFRARPPTQRLRNGSRLLPVVRARRVGCGRPRVLPAGSLRAKAVLQRPPRTTTAASASRQSCSTTV